ncbi:hypothetical protein RA271_29120, partial [Pseudomonas syringae pv. tagetis]
MILGEYRPRRVLARLMSLFSRAFLILGKGSLGTARRIHQMFPDAVIYCLAEVVQFVDSSYREFGALLRQLFQNNSPIISLC